MVLRIAVAYRATKEVLMVMWILVVVLAELMLAAWDLEGGVA